MPAEFLFAPTPHTEAIDFIAGKPLVSREVFAGLLPELKARAFTIAGVENAAVCAGIRAKLAQLPAGVPWDKLKKQIADDLHPFLADPEEPGNRIAAERRAELLLRTHGFQAYQAAAHEVGERQADVFPFLQYVTMGDGKVRPAHAALNGVVLPRNHEFWKTHTPPWDWGCRCQAIPISADDHADAVAADAKKPEDQQNVLSEYAQHDLTATRRLVRNGVSYNVSSPAEKGKQGAFVSHPGDLRLPLADLRNRYDAQTWDEFEKWAKQQALDGITTVGGPLRMEYVRGKTEQQGQLANVWEWLNGAKIAQAPTPAPEAKPAAKPKPSAPVVAPIAAVSPSANLTAEQILTGSNLDVHAVSRWLAANEDHPVRQVLEQWASGKWKELLNDPDGAKAKLFDRVMRNIAPTPVESSLWRGLSFKTQQARETFAASLRTADGRWKNPNLGMSTSHDFQIAREFATKESHPIFLEVQKSKTGRDIDTLKNRGLGFFSNEREITFLKGSRFAVVGEEEVAIGGEAPDPTTGKVVARTATKFILREITE